VDKGGIDVIDSFSAEEKGLYSLADVFLGKSQLTTKEGSDAAAGFGFQPDAFLEKREKKREKFRLENEKDFGISLHIS